MLSKFTRRVLASAVAGAAGFLTLAISADAQALAQRGYLPTSESFVEGRWRGIDWLGAIIFAILFFLIGLVIIFYMATNKPGGVATVHYTRSGSGLSPLAAAPRPEVADRLRTLDDLRRDGLIDDAEWTSRREVILAEV